MSESENNNEENKQWIESESLQEKNQLNICNSTARQILKKQITYSPGAAHTSLNNIGLNRYNSFNTKEEDSTEANLLKVKQHDNTLANNHNLSYESRMSSVNQEFSLHRTNECENLNFTEDSDFDTILNKTSHLKRTNELENLSEII